jgi:putative membrane protein
MHWLDWSGGGWLMMIFLWVLIIVGIVIVTKWFANQTSHSTHEDTAMEILKKRYARGEISKEEYEQMKKDLL